MTRQVKQLLMLSGFAAGCMALGMGLSSAWVARAQEEQPVQVSAKSAERLPPIADVAEAMNPTVVAITNTSFVKARGRGGDSPFGDDFYHWFFGPQRPNTRRPQEEEQKVQAGGSGFLISSDGEILTNHHVIEGLHGGEATLEVKTSDGRTFKAKVLGKDKELDIALIKIDAKHMPYARLGDSDAARVGEWVVAIGNPLGLEHTVTQGIISAKGRQLTGAGLESFLQTDAAINRGNSGGPLFGLKGDVLGINTAIRADGQNIGFAVPVNMVKRILPDLRSGRPVSRGYLGVQTRAMDKEFQESLGVNEGAVVSSVERGTPADKAGVQRLDVITAVDGKKVRGGDELVAIIANRRAGETVTVTVWRNGAAKDIKVVLGDRKELQKAEDQEENDEVRPEEKKEGKDKAVDLEKTYGFTVEALSPANRHQFGVGREAKGVVVTFVATRSGAADKGLQAGMVITAVGTTEVEDLAAFNQEVRKAGGRKPLLLLIRLPRTAGGVTLAIPPR